MDKWQIGASILAVIVIGLGTGWLIHSKNLENKITTLEATNATLFSDLETTRADFASSTASFESKVALLTDTLTATEEERKDLQQDLRHEKNRNEDFEDQIGELSDTLEVLDKLSKTDEELLQKYSKVSFLNEHYIPESLKDIDDEWKYSEERTHELHSKVIPVFEDMLEEAKDDDIEIWVVSAYRSFEDQTHIKGHFLTTFGSGANAFSADQGFSEHQLGTTIDFTTRGLGGGLVNGFKDTEAYEWLLDNAHKYGFTLSYPEGNQFYIFEPWHWRFVGEDLARDLKKNDAYFYDWDQREIDEYLIKIFD